MIKSELIAKIAATNVHLLHRDVERIINVVFDEIVDALARGERVELRGFGAFTVKHRTARQGRNPRTGDSVAVDEKFVPFFKTGKELREKLNEPAAKPAGKSGRKPAAGTSTSPAGTTASKASDKSSEKPRAKSADTPVDKSNSKSPPSRKLNTVTPAKSAASSKSGGPSRDASIGSHPAPVGGAGKGGRT